MSQAFPQAGNWIRTPRPSSNRPPLLLSEEDRRLAALPWCPFPPPEEAGPSSSETNSGASRNPRGVSRASELDGVCNASSWVLSSTLCRYAERRGKKKKEPLLSATGIYGVATVYAERRCLELWGRVPRSRAGWEAGEGRLAAGEPFLSGFRVREQTPSCGKKGW